MHTDVGFDRSGERDAERTATRMEITEMSLDRAVACVEEREGEAHFERAVGRTYLVAD